jgi:hypothetical protein
MVKKKVARYQGKPMVQNCHREQAQRNDLTLFHDPPQVPRTSRKPELYVLSLIQRAALANI